jgi:hypothetical protein
VIEQAVIERRTRQLDHDLRAVGLTRSEFVTQLLEIGEFTRIQQGIQPPGQDRLDAMPGGQFEQPDYRPAGFTLRESRLKLFPRTAIGFARKQPVTEDQSPEGLRLAFECVDEVSVVERVGLTTGRTCGARGAVHECPGQVAVEPFRIEPHPQAMPDQS